ncbi:MAG: PSD1 and planctomycete cytochrome C domain-containing protein [Planctomycetota bacterium]
MADVGSATFSAEQLEFFENKIRPVLVENCYACHSHEAERNKGGFYLDSRQSIIDDVIAEPGAVEDSLLIEAVRYQNPDYAMPPAGKLPDEVIADLERWVEMGMPWPEEAGPGGSEVFDLAARRASHWAWQRPKRTEKLPEVPGREGEALGAIDRFIEARLAEEGMKPSPPADRATLIRRVTLDLTGTPPTLAELDAFLADESPDAYEQLVDRLLASPRYGEKWGRHWLDLMRYAESYGHEFDYTTPHAWKYRDYVIRALNDDLPYDRFVTEHIAGDLVEPRIHPETMVNEAVVATGWWFMHEQTHGPTDVRQHEADRIDNQIDVLSKSFLGMTVACARCHDHKFDAIGDEDYYAMAGYLQSSRQQVAYLDPASRIEQALGPVRRVIAEGQVAYDALDRPVLEPTAHEHADSSLFEDFNGASYEGWRTTGWAWGEAPTRPGQWDPRSGRAQAVRPGLAHSGLLGDEAVGTLWSSEFDFANKHIWVRVKGAGEIRLILDTYTVNRFSQLLFEGFISKVDTQGKWQWVELKDRRGLFAGKGLHRGHLEIIDDRTDAHLIVDEIRLGDNNGPREGPREPNASAQSVELSQADAPFAALSARFNEAASHIPGPQRALAIADGSAEDSYVHIRGSYRNQGETIPRRDLEATGGLEMTPVDEGSGRDQFARAITDPAHPLTARVQVNRLWHHLFGRGIVSTVDNLGYLGIPPTHPELLDHLAVLFVEEDAWSTKAMIKRIVMSQAYRRSSDKTDTNAEAADPDNLLLRRQNIRRLTAEGIRDSVLAVSGSLKDQMYGPSVPAALTEFMQGRGRPKSGPVDGNGRRSIYIGVRRNFLSPMMLVFDAPIPFSTVGRRNVTNVPAQALTLLNDPFIHEMADRWSRRVVKDGSQQVDQRIDGMFRTALGRPPTPQELEAARGFITMKADQLNLNEQRVMSDARPWRELCHTMFNLKGFIYIR